MVVTRFNLIQLFGILFQDIDILLDFLSERFHTLIEFIIEFLIIEIRYILSPAIESTKRRIISEFSFLKSEIGF